MPTLNESFTVSNPANALATISDLNKLVPCVPGARVVSSDGPNAVKAEIEVKMGSMGMKFVGPVTIESVSGQTVKIKAKTTEAGGQSAAQGDVTITLAGTTGTLNAVANVNGKAASMGEGTVVAVLTQLVKQFAAKVGTA